MQVILPSHQDRSPLHPLPLLVLASILTAVAAWLSQGHVAYTGAGAARIALLPVSFTAAIIASAAGAGCWWALRRGASAAPLALLSLVLLPWLPVSLPPVLLLWNGRLALLVWLAIGIAMAASFRLTRAVVIARPQLVAGAVAFAVGALGYGQVRALLPTGDEPHYLVITQSLLSDGDVRIENNHARRDYRAYYGGDLAPDYRVRGRNGQIYSIHAPGVPALVAPVFALAGYPAVVFFVLILSSLCSALAWHLAWLVSRRTDAAWFGWAAVTLSTTWIFHSFTVYPDLPGALGVLCGVWGLLRAEEESTTRVEAPVPWLLHGAALAALPWMHTRFAVFAGTLGALTLLRLGRTANPLTKAGAFLLVPAVSAVCWIGYFIVIYGTPNPAIAYGNESGSFAFISDGVAGLFFDQRFGLFAYAPVLLAAAAGLAVMLRGRPSRRHALEFLFVAVPYVIVVTHVAMWWGGSSAPARFLVPLLPWMAVPAASAWAAAHRRETRFVLLAALAFTVFASVVMVVAQDGRLALGNTREGHAVWLEWLNGSVDLGRGLPAWWREREAALFRGIAVWGLCAAAAWGGLHLLAGRSALASRPRFATAGAFVLAAAGAAAMWITWTVERVEGRAAAPAQLETLRQIATVPRLVALDLAARRAIAPDAVPQLMQIEPAFSVHPGGAGRSDRPLFAVPAIPAGDYRVRLPVRSSSGWIMIGIGRDQFAILTEPLESLPQPLVVRFPVGVRALMVRGDEDARRNVRGLLIEPQRVLRAGERLTRETASRAVRYRGGVVFFLDDRAFPDPDAFWVGGARQASVVIQPDENRPSMALLVRNGAVDNTVLLEAGGWRDALKLGPGEERRIDLPLDQQRGATLLRFTTSTGFRPSERDPANRDQRFLGVHVRVVE